MVVDTPLYRMGQTVTVQPRTAPGFNFGGGEGRICQIKPVSSVAQPPAQRQERVATTRYLYDVRFIIGSNTERHIDALWIAPKAATAERTAPLGHDPPAASRSRRSPRT